MNFLSKKNILLILATLFIFVFILALKLNAQDYTKGCTSKGCHENKKEFKSKHSVLEQCETCHSATDEKKHKFSLTMEGNSLCYMCHDNLEKGKVNHIAKSGESCTTCHDPHGSENKPLLTMASGKELCGMCHGTDFMTKKHVHGPLQGDDCITCHNPHSSDNPKLLTMKGNDLCSMCHGDMKEEFKKSKSVHMPAKLNCKSCHDPHSTDQPKYIKKEITELCLSCHVRAIRSDKKLKAQFGKGGNGNNCINCHNPHYAKNALLLKKPQKSPCPVLK